MIKVKYLGVAGFALTAGLAIGLAAPVLAEGSGGASASVACSTVQAEAEVACVETRTLDVSLVPFADISEAAKTFYIGTAEGSKLDFAQDPVGGWIDVKDSDAVTTIGKGAGHLSLKIDLKDSKLSAKTLKKAVLLQNTTLTYVIDDAEYPGVINGIDANRFFYDETEKAIYYFWGQPTSGETFAAILAGTKTLKMKVEIENLDQIALNAAKESASALDYRAYTPDSWTVLEAAQALPEATQANVDTKATAITDAIEGLVDMGMGYGPEDPTVTADSKVDGNRDVVSWTLSDYINEVDEGGTNFLSKISAENKAFALFVTALPGDSVFIALDDYAGCKTEGCKTNVTIDNLTPGETYYLYHFTKEGYVKLVGKALVADGQGVITTELNGFSGYVLTSAEMELTDGVVAPETGVVAAKADAAGAEFGAATVVAALGTAAGGVVLKKRA